MSDLLALKAYTPADPDLGTAWSDASDDTFSTQLRFQGTPPPGTAYYSGGILEEFTGDPAGVSAVTVHARILYFRVEGAANIPFTLHFDVVGPVDPDTNEVVGAGTRVSSANRTPGELGVAADTIVDTSWSLDASDVDAAAAVLLDRPALEFYFGEDGGTPGVDWVVRVYEAHLELVTGAIETINVTRQWPRDDSYGAGSATRIHPPPRRGRIVGGQT